MSKKENTRCFGIAIRRAIANDNPKSRQLLHYEPTRAMGIDVVVLVTPDVDAERRLQLRKDGAMVRPIEFVHGKHDDWLHPKEGRWNDIMSKLRAWEMTEYSRVSFTSLANLLLMVYARSLLSQGTNNR